MAKCIRSEFTICAKCNEGNNNNNNNKSNENNDEDDDKKRNPRNEHRIIELDFACNSLLVDVSNAMHNRY